MDYTLLERIKIRLRQFDIQEQTDEKTGKTTEVVVFNHKEDNPFLNELIDKAKQDVIAYRNYPKGYSDEMIAEDVKKLENIIIEVVLYDYDAEGIEGTKQHGENGVNQTFVKRESILGQVIPFVKVL